MQNIRDLIKEKVLILDGAMGTQIQNLKFDESIWEGKQGCNELLNTTAKDEIKSIHRAYLRAGADILKTNTFGVMPWVLDEYEIGDRAYELCFNGVRVAKETCKEFNDKPIFVATSFGPGTKLPSLGHIEYDEMYEGYRLCANAAIEAKTDLFLIETAQDPLQIKAALNAIYDVNTFYHTCIPVMVSVTIELSGTMLIGTDVNTIVTILEPYDILSLGFNCGTGPAQLSSHLKTLSTLWNRPISIHANAGLPENRGGYTYYPMEPDEFAKLQHEFLNIDGVAFLGGCCGTTPQHISKLCEMARKIKPKAPKGDNYPSISSLYESKTLIQQPAPFLIGERSNATGSKVFRELLLDENYSGILAIAQTQVRNGAHGIDINVGFAGRDESKDMRRVASDYSTKIALPLMIDSTQTNTLEIALKNIGGRAIINSANLEDVQRFHEVCSLAKRYGAALICLCIDENGMAKTKHEKIKIAQRMYELAISEHGFRGSDLVFDFLTFTVGSGDSQYFNAAIETLEAIKEFSKLHPEVGFVLGISNISFGLDVRSREYLNSVFLYHCVNAGLSMAIVNVKNIIPFHKIDENELKICNDLLFNKRENGNPLLDFINYFSVITSKNYDTDAYEALSVKEKISALLIDGDKSRMLELLPSAKETFKPEDIVNEILIKAMQKVGELFGAGKMQLPFVLQSAEVMSASVEYLNPFLPKIEKKTKTTIVIGTVKGDVHDVGKNLVDIILTNNGFKVINIGIKAELAEFLKAAKEHNADAIGMSGLLVKSTTVMMENLIHMREQGINTPVILGGAALNDSFIENFCRPNYDGPLFYCKDAFEGIIAMGKIEKKDYDTDISKKKKKIIDKPKIPIHNTTKESFHSSHEEILTPPFWGRKVFDFDVKELAFEWINHKILFSQRWGYSSKNLKQEARQKQTEEILWPLYEKMKKVIKNEELFKPTILYGYWPCRSEGNKLYIFHEEEGYNSKDKINKEPLPLIKQRAIITYDFPREQKSPNRCISDLFRSKSHDVVAFTCVSVGAEFTKYCSKLYEDGKYKEYYELHGISVELAEALAEIAHKQVRVELGIAKDEGKSLRDVQMKKYQGRRYSFGYPACPDISDIRHIFELLRPEEFGITLSQIYQMHPEQTTSALVAYNRDAKYFTIKDVF